MNSCNAELTDHICRIVVADVSNYELIECEKSYEYVVKWSKSFDCWSVVKKEIVS